jgi:hypothetical protein
MGSPNLAAATFGYYSSGFTYNGVIRLTNAATGPEVRYRTGLSTFTIGYPTLQTPVLPAQKELRFAGGVPPANGEVLVLNNFVTGQVFNDPDFQFRYVGYGTFRSAGSDYFEAFVYGFVTLGTDLPTARRTWSISARAELTSDRTKVLGGVGVMEFEPTTQTISALVNMTDGATAFESLSGTCTLLNDQRCTGSMTTASGRYAGEFAARMLGPRGAEIGLAYRLTSTTGALVGSAVGK